MAQMIKQSRVAIISDLHLGVHSNSSHWLNIALDWAKWLRDELLNKDIKDIIFCGDWYHSRSEISVLTLHASSEIMDVLDDFNIIMIVGNHDMYFKHRTDVNSLSIFNKRDNVSVFDKHHTITQFNKTISFCPWNTALSDVERSDVIFSHLELNTFKMNASRVCDFGVKVSDALRASPLIFSGHFHARQEREYKEGKIIYIGNPFHMDYSDVDNIKGYYILDFDDLSYEFHENVVSPRHEKIKLSELVKL
jgi:DNA repair exonuclease SbcCD nuclease subunit